jgi:hypothetical protein
MKASPRAPRPTNYRAYHYYPLLRFVEHVLYTSGVRPQPRGLYCIHKRNPVHYKQAAMIPLLDLAQRQPHTATRRHAQQAQI